MRYKSLSYTCYGLSFALRKENECFSLIIQDCVDGFAKGDVRKNDRNVIKRNTFKIVKENVLQWLGCFNEKKRRCLTQK